VLAVVIAVGIAFLGVADQFGKFLTVIGVVVPPFAGLLIAHFWVLRRRTAGAEVLRDVPAVRWEAVACWIVAALIAYYAEFLLVNAVEGLVAGFVLYALVGLLTVRRRTAAPVEA
jgi:cytosine permease